MLLGTEIGAALTALEVYDVDAIGLNCATGPREMNDAVRYLSVNSSKHVSVLPNAGLPQNVGGRAVYALSPQELADYHRRFVLDYGVRIVGGCCGTTPEHLKAVVEAVGGLRTRGAQRSAGGSGRQRLHHGSAGPRPEAVDRGRGDEHHDAPRTLPRPRQGTGITTRFSSLAKKLVNEGSHMLDLCCAIVGEDEKSYMSSVLEKIATRVPAPILVDSTEADVIEEALKRIPGFYQNRSTS